MKKLIPTLTTGLLLAAMGCYGQAQESPRVVQAGVPFLLLSPDARGSGVAEAVTGLFTDANSLHGNAAKILFGDRTGISISYTPWMRELVKDAHYAHAAAYKHLNEREALGMSVKYLNLGEIDFRDNAGNPLGMHKANEFSVDIAYARKLGDYFSMALAARYVHSDLGTGQFNGLEQEPAGALAADISIYHEKYIESGEYDKRLAWGLSITNIGTKLQYTGNEKTFLPMNLRLGAGYSFYADPENRLTVLMDLNKLLVPTPPVYNSSGEIVDGKDPNRSVVSSFFSSMFDAPGGFGEEISEFSLSAGLEYSYMQQFYLRTGYFYEDPDKGNRQHFAAGAGLKVGNLGFDFSYLIPTGSRFTLKKTAKFSLIYSFNEKE